LTRSDYLGYAGGEVIGMTIVMNIQEAKADRDFFNIG